MTVFFIRSVEYVYMYVLHVTIAFLTYVNMQFISIFYKSRYFFKNYLQITKIHLFRDKMLHNLNICIIQKENKVTFISQNIKAHAFGRMW